MESEGVFEKGEIVGKIAFWDAKPLHKEVMRNGMKRLEKSAEVVAKKARLKCPEGKLSRPMYKTGRYAGQFWTARDAGALKKSIRVVKKRGSEKLNIRVYSGTAKTYYAQIVEHYTPFMRPALNASKSQIASIMKNG